MRQDFETDHDGATRGQHPDRVSVLMVVHAHPDDESTQTGGTLAAYAAAGWQTVLITCTDGAQGDGHGGAKPGQPGHGPLEVARRRSRELDLAAVALGVHDLVKFGYPDSGAPDNDTSAAPDVFSRRPLAPIVARLVGLIRLHQPNVIVTYPPNGLSGHPDHVRTHDLVRAALLDVEADRTPAHDSSDPSDAVVRPLLYYIAVSRSRLRAMQAGARAAFGPDAWVPPDEIGTHDADITTVIDIATHWRDKLRALSSHVSQSDARSILGAFTAAERADIDGHVEEYIRATARSIQGAVEPGFGGTAPTGQARDDKPPRNRPAAILRTGSRHLHFHLLMSKRSPKEQIGMSSHATSKIFVIGGTGAQGIPIIRDLVKDGKYSVRVLTRDSSSARAKGLLALGNVSFLEGSFADEAILREGFRSCDGAFVNLDGFNTGEKAEVYWAIRSYEIAIEEGIEFFVYGNLDYALKKSGYDSTFRAGHYDGKGRIAE
jgi:LmbE family N-acetylglucosaminyl deacetylase